MAQGSLFRLLNNTTNYRSILNNSSRITITGQHQCAGLKQEVINKIQDLNIPEKPKKPLSAYFSYMADHRVNLAKKFPNIKIIELSTKIAEEWAATNEKLKDDYRNRYKVEMDSYKTLYDDYNAKLTPIQKDALETLEKAKKADKQRRITRKMNKEEDRPKRPIGPYMQYLLITCKREGLKMNEVLSSMKGKWALLSDSEKEKYNELYRADKERYETKMKVWENKMIKEGKTALVRQITQLAAKQPRLKAPKPIEK